MSLMFDPHPPSSYPGESGSDALVSPNEPKALTNSGDTIPKDGHGRLPGSHFHHGHLVQHLAEPPEATPSRKVRVTVVQAATVLYDTRATLVKAEALIKEAAAAGAQLVHFPEAFIGGYPRGSSFGVKIGSRTESGREEFRKYHSAAIHVPGPEVDSLSATSSRHRVFLVMGAVEKEGGTLYCTLLFFDPLRGLVGKHRKLMPTAGERFLWGAGGGGGGEGEGGNLPVFETEVGRVGGVICWENRMPLLRMAMYAKGIEIYCAPTADARDSWQSTVRHIAMEGGCFVLSANQFCMRQDYPDSDEYSFRSGSSPTDELLPTDVVCRGGSVIVAPSGAVLAGPKFDGEGLITADLDLGDIVRAKFDFDVVGHYSRPDIFNLTVKEQSLPVVSFI